MLPIARLTGPCRLLAVALAIGAPTAPGVATQTWESAAHSTSLQTPSTSVAAPLSGSSASPGALPAAPLRPTPLPTRPPLSPSPAELAIGTGLALPTLAEPTTPDYLRLGEDMADRMTMPVRIQGVGPYPFLIDTGSHRSIVATELATRLALQTLPPVEIISIAGRETVAAVHLGELRFGSQVVSDLPALSIAHQALGSAGLIGLDSLQDKRLTLDFRKREMTVGPSARALERRDRNVIVVTARSKLGQLILVNSNIEGRRVNVILDTGAELSVGNMALFEKLKEKRLVVPPRPVVIHTVTGQPVAAQFSIVRRLRIGTLSIDNMPMVFLDAAPFVELGLAGKPSMLLGMKMLRMFDRVAIDFGNRHVDFELPPGADRGNDREALLAMR